MFVLYQDSGFQGLSRSGKWSKNSENFQKKSGKIRKKMVYIYMLGTLFRVLPAVFRVHCGFPNMESEAVPNEK